MKRKLSLQETEVEWLGSIPQDWRTSKLRYSAQYINGYPFKPTDWQQAGKPIIRIQTLTGSGDNQSFFSGELDSRYLVQQDDILFSWSTTLGVYVWEGPNGWLNQHIFKVLPADHLNRRYFVYLLGCLISYLSSKAHGSTMTHVTKDKFGSVVHPVPSMSEQAAIASFLDEKTNQIDTLIEKKRKMIELLREERQALINQAVTKGLDPNVKLKHSGIEWLGDVPEHWAVRRLKHSSKKISKGTTPSTEGADLVSDGPVRFIKAENIYENRLSHEPNFSITNETNELLKRSQLRENDILVVIAGATIGKVAVVTSHFLPANTNQAVCFIRPVNGLRARFVWYWLQSSRIRELVWLEAVQAAQPNLSMEDIGNFSILEPPPLEEESIVEYLDIKTLELDILIEKAERGINLLSEYRATLISEAVTGKLAVS